MDEKEADAREISEEIKVGVVSPLMQSVSLIPEK